MFLQQLCDSLRLPATDFKAVYRHVFPPPFYFYFFYFSKTVTGGPTKIERFHMQTTDAQSQNISEKTSIEALQRRLGD